MVLAAVFCGALYLDFQSYTKAARSSQTAAAGSEPDPAASGGSPILGTTPKISESLADIANKKCPKPQNGTEVYRSDKPRNQTFSENDKIYFNLYGKPCEGPLIKAFCSKENYCDGKMENTTCLIEDKWAPCAQQPEIQVACLNEADCTFTQPDSPPPPDASPSPINPELGETSAQDPLPSPQEPNTVITPQDGTVQPITQLTEPQIPEAPATSATGSQIQNPADWAVPEGAPVEQQGQWTTLDPSAPVAPIANPVSPVVGTPLPLPNDAGAPLPQDTNTTFGQPTPPTDTSSSGNSYDEYGNLKPKTTSVAATGAKLIAATASLLFNLVATPFNFITNLFQPFASRGSEQDTRPTVSAPRTPQTFEPTRPLVSYGTTTPSQGSSATPPTPVTNIIIISTDPHGNIITTTSTVTSLPPKGGVKPVSASIDTSPSQKPTQLRDLLAPTTPSPAPANNAATTTTTDTGERIKITMQTATSTRLADILDVYNAVGTSTPDWLEETLSKLGVIAKDDETPGTGSILEHDSVYWTQQPNTARDNKIELAKAKATYDAIQAHIDALREAINAGLCDEQCMLSIDSLQDQLPIRRAQIEELDAVVKKDTAPSLTTPPPTIAQTNRIIEGSIPVYIYGTESATISNRPTTPVHLAAQETPNASGTVSGETIVARVVKNIWGVLKSLFAPEQPAAPVPQKTCSLFLSLLGKCGA